MAENKKYYYLKLKDNFFDSDAMIVLESMPDGYLYSNILMKLFLRSLKNEGKLMFNEKIPYNSKILAQVTRHHEGVIEKAIKIFAELDLIEVMDNGAIFILDIQNYIGKSSSEADRQREYYDRIKDAKGDCLLVDGKESCKEPNKFSTPEKEIEKEIEKEKEKKKEKEPDVDIFFSECWDIYPNKKGKGQIHATKKKEILKLGDEFKRCIGRYIKSVDGQRASGFKDLNYQNGSTFFNSGYVDYLDKNYKELVKVQQGGPLGVELSPSIKNGRRDNW